MPSCLSVLTDEEFFGGSITDLQLARAACPLPVLRKDFTVSAADVCDARLMGADCVLLIVAALSPADVVSFHRLAVEIGLDVLVEIHDEPELDVALAAGATLIGVNQRDLVTFQVDHARAERMAGLMPAGVVRVAESGVRDGDDARRLHDAGYHAVLVGETLVTAGDPAAAIAVAAELIRSLRRLAAYARDGCSSRSAGSPARTMRSSPWPWEPTRSASSSPPRRARWPCRTSTTSPAGCRRRSSPSACSVTSSRSG